MEEIDLAHNDSNMNFGSCVCCGDQIKTDRYCSCWKQNNSIIEKTEIDFQEGSITYKELDEIGRRISEDSI